MGNQSCTRLSTSPINIANPPSPESEITCRSGNVACAPIACAIAFAVEPCQKEPIKRRSPFIAEVAGSPDRRQSDVAGEYSVLCGKIIECPCDLLWMDKLLSRRASSQVIEIPARFAVVRNCQIEKSSVLFFLDQRKNGLNCRSNVTDNGVHQYFAESLTHQKRMEWIAALDKIEALKPSVVIAGHKCETNSDGPNIIDERRQYIRDFDRLLDSTSSTRELYDCNANPLSQPPKSRGALGLRTRDQGLKLSSDHRSKLNSAAESRLLRAYRRFEYDLLFSAGKVLSSFSSIKAGHCT